MNKLTKEPLGFGASEDVFTRFIPDKETFDEGMAAMRLGDRLHWVNDDEWIYVADLPESLVEDIMRMPCYAATNIVACYLDDIDEPLNEGYD